MPAATGPINARRSTTQPIASETVLTVAASTSVPRSTATPKPNLRDMHCRHHM
jgi:hypothetical protein